MMSIPVLGVSSRARLEEPLLGSIVPDGDATAARTIHHTGDLAAS